MKPLVSVCTTSFNCALVLPRHLASIVSAMEGLAYEYIVVDNRSIDGTRELLERSADENEEIVVNTARCTRGAGRERAARLARAPVILTVDVDTVYGPGLRRFCDAYLRRFRDEGLAVQAIYAGLYPTDLWFRAGGMRDLNFAEDFDLWMRVWETGRMRWTPVVLGENLKPLAEQDGRDVVSSRYSRVLRVQRLIQRELDLWRLRAYSRLDLRAIWQENAVDLGLGPLQDHWFGEMPPWSTRGSVRRFAGDLIRILAGSRQPRGP